MGAAGDYGRAMSDEVPDLPPCGLYVTRAVVGTIPEGRLVYFHNHGDPGPGLYLPSSWRGNRARFEARGHLLPEPADVRHLAPLPLEGFYRVVTAFHCCNKNCRLFEADALVQLGYDGSGRAILFTPEWIDGQLAIPEQGTRVDEERLDLLRPLKVPVSGTRVHDDDADEKLLH